MKKPVIDAVNEQIKAEFESAYVYLAMSAKMELMSFPGFGQWLRIQWQEETAHALKLLEHLLHRDVEVDLQAIAKPQVTFKTPLEAFQEVLKHERYITKRIHDLYDLSVTEKDYPLQTLLQWFIDEQVEEEEAARGVLESLEMAGDSGPALLLLDRELGARQPVPEGQ